MPTGSELETAKGYFDYLYSTYYGHIQLERATQIWWVQPIKIFVWAAILIAVFGLYAYSFQQAHRKRGELYEPMSFAGSLLERNGLVSAFTWVSILAIFLSAVYLAVKYMFTGYLY